MTGAGGGTSLAHVDIFEIDIVVDERRSHLVLELVRRPRGELAWRGHDRGRRASSISMISMSS
jgi:hypothetical protein